jgi:hypothetical protein
LNCPYISLSVAETRGQIRSTRPRTLNAIGHVLLWRLLAIIFKHSISSPRANPLKWELHMQRFANSYIWNVFLLSSIIKMYTNKKRFRKCEIKTSNPPFPVFSWTAVPP